MAVNQSRSGDKVTLASHTQDRLGSIGKFYPYGTERPSATMNDTEKFTGYFRDGSTGLDYADQRYHQPGMGRFMTPDAAPSASATDPGSWNRYAYVGGDPVNRIDPSGLFPEDSGFMCAIYDTEGAVGAELCGDPGIDETWLPGYVLSEWMTNGMMSYATSAIQGYLFAKKLSWADARAAAELAFPTIHSELKTEASGFAAKLRSGSISPPCGGDLNALGITAGRWADALDNVDIRDGVGSTEPLSATMPYSSVIGSAYYNAVANFEVLGYEFENNRPGNFVQAFSSTVSNLVYIDPGFIKAGATAANSALIAHEALHNLGLNDTQIGNALNLDLSNGSIAISNRLMQDCF